MDLIFQPEWECLPRPRLRQLVGERLTGLLARLGQAPAYRDRPLPNHLGADPVAALPEWPFTTKADLRAWYPWGYLAVPVEQLARIHASSGTRGKPTLVGYSAGDLAIWADVVARALCAAGARPGDLLHNAYGYGLFTGGLGLHQGAERLGMTVVPASGGATRRQATLLRDLRPQGLSCTPSFALNLADALDELGQDPAGLGLQYGIFGAEPWTDALRRRIELRFGLHAVDIYGLSEIIGPGVAIECREEQAGLHIAEDHFYPEVVDPGSGDPVDPGGLGELVLTTLTKEAMPLLRYRTGDLVRLIDEPCRCGRTVRRMSRVVGRVDDMVIVRGVNVFPSEIERVLLGFPMLRPYYQLVWEQAGSLDRLRVEVEYDPALPASARLGLTRTVAGELRQELSVTVEVSLMEPGTLPRPEGKAVRVVDRRPLETP